MFGLISDHSEDPSTNWISSCRPLGEERRDISMRLTSDATSKRLPMFPEKNVSDIFLESSLSSVFVMSSKADLR